MTLTGLKEMSLANKLLVLTAVDVLSMQDMDRRPGIRYSRVSVALIGRRGYLDYSIEEIDSELEDYAPDFEEFETLDELIGWAQKNSLVQFIDPEKRDWKYRPK